MISEPTIAVHAPAVVTCETPIHEHVLLGCRPKPLASYLKALGVLRLVASQADASARGFWRGDTFVLQSRLDGEALQTYFLHAYEPTPVVAPWNGGSGFYAKDNQVAIDAIRGGSAKRFAAYRQVIHQATELLDELQITEKVNKDEKPRLLEACRARLSNEALPWLDAVFVLSDDGPSFPPLLGTGGNDGRLDFTNNFMQRVLDVLESTSGKPTATAAALLDSALFAETVSGLLNVSVGQFAPGNAGGANATTGFGGGAFVNPWDFVLMIEGAMVFAAAATRRLGQTELGALSYPFTVRQAAVGYGSAADSDAATARAEVWMPLWGRPTSLPELVTLFAEGRARVGKGRGRAVRHGVDFARAVSTLGVDRGIGAFQRYGFQVRNGLAYFATPLSRALVRTVPKARVVDEIDGWLDRFRSAASSDKAPASVSRALRNLDNAIVALCTHGDNRRVLDVLTALGACERAMAHSPKWAQDERLPQRPVPLLSSEWLVDDGSVELRLAAALASVYADLGPHADRDQRYLPLRRHLEPVVGVPPNWDKNPGRMVAWQEGPLGPALVAIMHRRILWAVQNRSEAGAGAYPDRARLYADLGDITDFIDQRVDDARLADLLWGCSLINWSSLRGHPLQRRAPEEARNPKALYALLKLCFPGAAIERRDDLSRHNVGMSGEPPPIEPELHRLAAVGRGDEAARRAVRRLRGSGWAPAVREVYECGPSAQRTAAALLFPIDDYSLNQLASRVMRPRNDYQGESP